MSMMLMVQAMACTVGNPARKLVLLKLADNSNDDGMSFPSYQYIADTCEMSRRAVIDHISHLEKMGLLRIKIRRQDKNRNSSNMYFLTLSGAQKVTRGSAESAPTLVQNLHPPSAESAPITSQLTTHTHNACAREKTLIADDFVINEAIEVQLFKSAVPIPVAEFLLDEFVSKNISTGYSSFSWANEFASYCIRNTWRYEKYEQSKSIGKSVSGQLTGASAAKAAVLERIKNM